MVLNGFELVGQLMGLAIRSGSLIPVNFPSIVWKALVGEEITAVDVTSIDLLSFQITDEIRRIIKLKKTTAVAGGSGFNLVMSDQKFEVHGSDQKIYELIPGGREISVTYENAEQFCTAYTDFRKSEFSVQCAAMRRGLATVVPVAMLSLFTWQELERQVCGSSFDMELLEQQTEYEGCNVNDTYVKLFWQMMKERFSDSERQKFLMFVWYVTPFL